MRTMATMLALVLSGAAVSAQPAEPEAPSICSSNVVEFGAKADGVSDDTAAFQKALDSAAAKGGAVLAPAGTYLIAGSLNVPQGVTLRGVWEAPHSADIGKGTVIYATGGAGNEDGSPLITLNQSSCVRGVTVLYPNQDIDAIQPYPWTIVGKGMHCSVIDVTLVNPYQAIDFGSNWNELHYVRNLFGCPLKTGIYVNSTTDIGRIENVHFNPHAWGRAAHPSAPTGDKWRKLVDYLPQHLTGFRIGKTDWEYMFNCFVIFPKVGFHFVKTEQGSANAVLTQCGSDIGPIAIQVDDCQTHAGIAFSNCQLMANVTVAPTNTGPVKFTNCGFWPIATTESQAVVDGTGTVMFTSCHFSDWGVDQPAIRVDGGSVIVNGCEFLAEKTQIELGQGTKSAAIFGNRMGAGQRIVNEASPSASIEIGMNIR